jgi:TatD-related deoxyribonuclease
MRIPVLDDHIHLSPTGNNVESVKRFEKAGGTHCILVNMPYTGMECAVRGDFRAQYEQTLKLCASVNKNTNVRAFAVIGPYPVEILSLAEKHGIEKAKMMMHKGVDDAAEIIMEGRAIGFGEIGRPHFEVSSEFVEASNEVIAYVFSRARDIGCPVVLHTERTTDKVYEELASIALRTGLTREKIVKHFARVENINNTHGIVPSVLASREVLNPALYQSPAFMLETDFLDDPQRPGAVLDITTVPKRVRQLLERNVAEDALWKIMKELPEKVYGIEIRI